MVGPLCAQSWIKPYSNGQQLLVGNHIGALSPAYFSSREGVLDFNFLHSPFYTTAVVQKFNDTIKINLTKGYVIKLFETKAGIFYYEESVPFSYCDSQTARIKYIGERPYLLKDKRLSTIRKNYQQIYEIKNPTGKLEEFLSPGVEGIKIDIHRSFSVDKTEGTSIPLSKQSRDVSLWYNDQTVKSINVFYKKNGEWILMEEAMGEELIQKFFQSIINSNKELRIVDNDTNILLLQSDIEDNKFIKSRFLALEAEKDYYILGPSDRDIVLYPNPTYGKVNIALVNYPIGKYSYRVSNIIGKVIYESEIYYSNHIKDDLSFLPKGSYLYSVFDENNRKLMTKKLIVITP